MLGARPWVMVVVLPNMTLGSAPSLAFRLGPPVDPPLPDLFVMSLFAERSSPVWAMEGVANRKVAAIAMYEIRVITLSGTYGC